MVGVHGLGYMVVDQYSLRAVKPLIAVKKMDIEKSSYNQQSIRMLPPIWRFFTTKRLKSASCRKRHAQIRLQVQRKIEIEEERTEFDSFAVICGTKNYASCFCAM